MTLLAHTREGVEFRGRDLYLRWASRLGGDRPLLPAFEMLPPDVQDSWDALAADLTAVMAHA